MPNRDRVEYAVLRAAFTKAIDAFGVELTKEIKEVSGDLTALKSCVHVRNTVLVDSEEGVYLPFSFRMDVAPMMLNEDQYRELKENQRKHGMSIYIDGEKQERPS